MSNSAIPIKVLTVDEPRMRFPDNKHRVWAAVRGGQDITYYKLPSTSFNNTGFNFNTPVPSRHTVVDRMVILQVPVSITFTGPGGVGAPNILQPGKDAFRAFPISSITNTVTCSINGFPISLELGEIVHALSRFHLDIDQKNEYISLLAQMDDNYQNYDDANGCCNNPLGLYGDNSAQVPRGAYPFTVVSNTPTSATITATLYEPVILPMTIWDGRQSSGFVNVDTLTWSWVLSNNTQRIWSHAESGSTITNIAVTFSQPYILIGFITPKLLERIPVAAEYPYFQISRYTTQKQSTLAPNASDSYTSNPIQLNSIPRKLYIYLRQSNSVTYSSLSNMIETTDTFLQINSLSVNWDNKNGVLSGASPAQLYTLSVLNGLKLPWVEFNGLTQSINGVAGQDTVVKGLTGSIVCLELGRDVGLREDQVEGLLDKINLQVTVNATNINQTKTLTPDLYLIAVYDGVLRITNNACYSEIGVVTRQDVINAETSYNISYSSLEKIYGGDFASSLKGFAQDVGHALAKYGPSALKVIRDDIIPTVKAVAPLLSGLGEYDEGEGISGGKRKYTKKNKGGVLYGGKGLPKSVLAKRMRY